mgnify:CR=1 FL=1
MNFYTNVDLIGNYILVRGIENGKRFKKKVKYKPTLYFETNKPSEYRTLHGKSVKPKKFDTIWDARSTIKEYSSIENSKLYGFESFQYTYINEKYEEHIDYDESKIRLATIDIETVADEGMPNIATANKPITAITISCMGEIVAFGYGEFDPPQNITYIRCDDEQELILKFLDTWEYFDPDCIGGWNIKGFDIPYLVNRIVAVFDVDTAKRLSPWKILKERRVANRGGWDEWFYPLGISILDYMLIYKKLTFVPRESYSLDYIAQMELGEKKLDYSEYENLNTFYRENHQKFMAYNVRDVTLVERLEDKLKLIELIFSMAYSFKCNYEDMLGSVKPWEVNIFNELIKDKIVFPPKSSFDDIEREELVGGFVKHPIVGMYDWVVSCDLNSLYPHLIRQYNISPETFRGKWLDATYTIPSILNENFPDKKYLEEVNFIASANRCLFTRDFDGLLPRLMEKLYDERTQFKKKMLVCKQDKENASDEKEKKRLDKLISKYNNGQLNRKIFLNACYGVLTNEFFRFYSHDNAEAITMGGQLAIQWIEKKLNGFLNKLIGTKDVDYIIACDTDSVYLNLGPLVKKYYGDGKPEDIVDALDMFVKEKIEPFIESSYVELQEGMNAKYQLMTMKRESICQNGIWTGKKRYILNTWDKEGVRYHEPQISITGLESVRSSTPSACRKKIEEVAKLIMTTDEETVQEFIIKFREEFRTLPLEEIAFPRGIKGIAKYSDSSSLYKKGTPIQVRSAILYNHFIEENKLIQLTPMFDGDKIKYCYLTLPNPVKDNVMAFHNVMPTVMNLEKYVDRDIMFEKSFLEPINRILDVIGWSSEKNTSLEDFFAR